MGLYDLLLASNINGVSGKVVANPDEEATAELEKLKVGDSVYSVVTKAVDDLTNYYTKSDVYTKTEVNNIAQARFQVVAELPSSDIQTNVIYLVPKSSAQTNNDYDEYIYALKSTKPDTYGWEKIGDTEIDLSGYVTTSALNTALADYTTTADLTTLLAGKQNTLTFDSTPTAQSTNPVTSGGIKSYIDEQGAKTVSGNPITITDAEAMSANNVIAHMVITQPGSGTPSLNNVRPFSVVTNLNINVADAETDPTVNKQYTINIDDKGYTGALDVKTGKLVATQLHYSLKSSDVDLMALQTASGYRGLSSTLNSFGLPPAENSQSTQHAAFSCFENVDSGAYQPYGKASIYPNGYVYFWDNNSTYANKSAFQQALKDIISNTGIEFTYKLATPLEIQLTPTQIELLENDNVITTNATSLDVTYQKNNGIGDTASALDKRVTSLESKVPQPPTTDGTYKLTVTVASGTPTYSWESAT